MAPAQNEELHGHAAGGACASLTLVNGLKAVDQFFVPILVQVLCSNNFC
jgi:hypothetical protein